MNTGTNTTNFRQLLGRMGERLAEERLRAEGWTIVERNFPAYYRSKIGEIDIIARPPAMRTVVFIEVKTRDVAARELGLDHPGQLAMHVRKQRSLIRSAMVYLGLHPTGAGIRFDLMLVDTISGEPLREAVKAGDMQLFKKMSKIVHLENVVGAF